MIHDTFIKVGDRTVAIKAHSHRFDDDAEQPAKSVPEVLVAKVVAPPEKKAPRRSTGAEFKDA